MKTSTNLTATNAEQTAPKCPGTVWNNNGYWYWRIKLPGDKSRRCHPLKMPGSDRAMSAEKPYAVAEQAAWREWEKAVHKAKLDPCGKTVNDICDAWCAHAAEYYRLDDGSRTSQARNSSMDVRLLRDMYGSQYVADLAHADMLALRDALIRSGICRSTVNSRMGTVRRMWKWALSEALIPATAKAELSQVEPLKPHRSAARETAPVRPADATAVQQTLEALMPNTADMVRVHQLTGMRPEEICGLAWSLIDTSSTPWVYRPTQHKNMWRNQPRVIVIGPRAREILERHRGQGDHPFSPAIATAEHMAAMREARKTPVQPSQRDRSDPAALRVPGDEWTTCAYARTILYACKRSGAAHWTPNQLRHAFATRVRRQFGLEATRAVLGHSTGARITDRYSFEALEDEAIRTATPAVEALG